MAERERLIVPGRLDVSARHRAQQPRDEPRKAVSLPVSPVLSGEWVSQVASLQALPTLQQAQSQQV
jgi:hypothetical protein